VKYGIHNNPLPNYSKYNKKWWTVQKGYNANPKETSQLKLMHKILKGNPKDYLLLQDKNAKETHRVKSKIKRKNSDIPDKPNNVKIIYKGKVTKKRPTNLRWTEVEHAYSQRKHRIFQNIDEAKPSLADLEPMYSSFTPRMVFRPPPSSKECLVRQKEKEALEPKLTINIMNRSLNSEIQDIDSTAYQILDAAKTNLFKRVKTAYGKRSDAGNLLAQNGKWVKSKDVVKIDSINFNTHRGGFRTGAFSVK
jgi:hypothetical protein